MKKLPAYKEAGAKCTDIMIILENGKIGKKNNREKLILTCLDAKVPMYLDFGFTDHGISDSVWGGEVWHEMSLDIHKVC